MKFPEVFALLLALACLSGPAVADQESKRCDSMTIGATVDPTGTVGIKPVESKPEKAINLLFRNGQPQPIVFETEPREGREVVWIRF